MEELQHDDGAAEDRMTRETEGPLPSLQFQKATWSNKSTTNVKLMFLSDAPAAAENIYNGTASIFDLHRLRLHIEPTADLQSSPVIAALAGRFHINRRTATEPYNPL